MSPGPSHDIDSWYRITSTWSFISLTGLLCLTVLPTAILVGKLRVPWPVALWGAVTWAVAVAIKRPLSACLGRRLTNRRPVAVAIWQGLLSAVLELGCAIPYLSRLDNAEFFSVIGFGAGAGAVEVIYVIVIAVRAKRDPAMELLWLAAARHSICVRYQIVIERAFAIVGHIGSRGLVYVGLSLGPARGSILVITSVLLFALVDGTAIYGRLCGWNWSDPFICRAAHGFFAAISVLELVIFSVSFPRR